MLRQAVEITLRSRFRPGKRVSTLWVHLRELAGKVCDPFPMKTKQTYRRFPES